MKPHETGTDNPIDFPKQMTANELADVLMFTKFQVDEDGTMIGVSHQAVDEVITMLRQFGLAESIIKQQQLEIEALKADNKFWQAMATREKIRADRNEQ